MRLLLNGGVLQERKKHPAGMPIFAVATVFGGRDTLPDPGNGRCKIGIPVVPVEESYTSKASLVDGDDMSIYGETKETPKFSGRRVTRGQYCTKEGVILNVDVNGASNIIRKWYPDAFRDAENYSYLTKTVACITREQLCGVLHTKKLGKPKRGGMRPYLHHEHMAKKLGYMKLFGASSVKDKPQYVEEVKKKKADKTAS